METLETKEQNAKNVYKEIEEITSKAQPYVVALDLDNTFTPINTYILEFINKGDSCAYKDIVRLKEFIIAELVETVTLNKDNATWQLIKLSAIKQAVDSNYKNINLIIASNAYSSFDRILREVIVEAIKNIPEVKSSKKQLQVYCPNSSRKLTDQDVPLGTIPEGGKKTSFLEQVYNKIDQDKMSLVLIDNDPLAVNEKSDRLQCKHITLFQKLFDNKDVKEEYSVDSAKNIERFIEYCKLKAQSLLPQSNVIFTELEEYAANKKDVNQRLVRNMGLIDKWSYDEKNKSHNITFSELNNGIVKIVKKQIDSINNADKPKEKEDNVQRYQDIQHVITSSDPYVPIVDLDNTVLPIFTTITKYMFNEEEYSTSTSYKNGLFVLNALMVQDFVQQFALNEDNAIWQLIKLSAIRQAADPNYKNINLAIASTIYPYLAEKGFSAIEAAINNIPEVQESKKPIKIFAPQISNAEYKYAYTVGKISGDTGQDKDSFVAAVRDCIKKDNGNVKVNALIVDNDLSNYNMKSYSENDEKTTFTDLNQKLTDFHSCSTPEGVLPLNSVDSVKNLRQLVLYAENTARTVKQRYSKSCLLPEMLDSGDVLKNIKKNCASYYSNQNVKGPCLIEKWNYEGEKHQIIYSKFNNLIVDAVKKDIETARELSECNKECDIFNTALPIVKEIHPSIETQKMSAHVNLYKLPEVLESKISPPPERNTKPKGIGLVSKSKTR